jgi:hypothetical protein
MRVHNLLLLLHLPIICTEGEKTLIDYFQSHVVTSSEYLDILRKKTIKKVVVEEIKACKRKGKKICKLNK